MSAERTATSTKVVNEFIENYCYTQQGHLGYEYNPWATTPEDYARQFFQALSELDVNKEINTIARTLRTELPRDEITKLFETVQLSTPREQGLCKAIRTKMSTMDQEREFLDGLSKYEKEKPDEKKQNDFKAFFSLPRSDTYMERVIDSKFPGGNLQEEFKKHFGSIATKIKAILSGEEEIQEAFEGDENLRSKALELFKGVSKNSKKHQELKLLVEYKLRQGESLFDFLLDNYRLSKGSDYMGDQRVLGRFFDSVLWIEDNPMKMKDIFG